jgi:HK97 family phage major capsid protein
MDFDFRELLKEEQKKRTEASALLDKKDLTKEDADKAEAILDEADALKHRADLMRRSVGDGTDEPPLDTLEQKANAGKPFAMLGDQLIAVARATGYGTAQYDRRLDAVKAAATGHSESVPADGGFLVQEDFRDELLEKTYQTGILVSRCDHVPVSAPSNSTSWKYIDETSRATGSRYGAVRVYRDAEADSINSSTVKFGRQKLDLERMTGMYYATEEEMQDTPMLTAVANRAFSKEFAFMIDDEIINGTGSGQMLGILESPCLVTVDKEEGQAADTIIAENISNMWAQLYAPSRANAIWLINQEVEPQLDRLYIAVGTGGIPVYMPPGGLSESPYGRIKNRPVIAIEQASALGDLGDIMLVDLSQYRYIDKGGLQAASSIHVAFTTAQTAFRFILRNNGIPLWKSVLTPYKGADDISPFVTLQAR